MLKYLETQVTFSEVPDEVTLCINITNCPYKCEGCHSPQLREDIGKILDEEAIESLIAYNPGITCISFMGGDLEPLEINKLCAFVHSKGLKTCWYSGNNVLNSSIELKNLNYIKIGPYIKSLGGLDSVITNQKFYEVRLLQLIGYKLFDITYKFKK